MLAIRGLYAGEEDDATGALRRPWRAAGTPLVDGFRGMDYAETGTIGGTGPHHFELFADLPEPVIDSIVDVLDRADAIEVRHWGGAMAQPGAGSGPKRAYDPDNVFGRVHNIPPSPTARHE